MPEDMWTIINRELAKQEGSRAGVPDTSYAGAFKEAMEYGTQQRAFKERKNAQMQKMMDLQIDGYQTNLGEADIKKKQDRLNQYIENNQGSMNDITLEYADLLKENINTHAEKVGKFKQDIDMIEDNRDVWLQKADDYFNREDKLNDQDYDDIENSIDDYVRMKNEIIENNADFLQLPAYKHVVTNMIGQEAVINDLLKESKDQGVFTEYEHGYLTQALKTGDYSIIEEERSKKKVLTAEYLKSYVSGPEGIEVAYNRNEMLNQLSEGKAIIDDGTSLAELGFVTAGQSITLKDIAEMDGGKLALAQIKKDSKSNLDRLNNIYRTKTGDDYIVARGGVSEHTSEGWSPSLSEIKILKDHHGMTDDEIKLIGLDEGTKLINEYDDETDKDGKEDKDSIWPTLAPAIVITGAIAHGTGMDQKAVEISKQVLNATKKGMKYVHHVAKNVPIEDINSFLDDKVVNEAVEDLNKLKEKMDLAEEKGKYSKTYKNAVKKYNKKVAQHANALKAGGRISLEGVKGAGKKVTRAIKNIEVKELERLLKNPNKWRTLRIKRKALKIMPALSKGWKALSPGKFGGFAVFEMGRRATRELMPEFMGEGFVATGAELAGGYGIKKAAFSKISRKIASKTATAAGRNWLVKKLTKKLGAKIAMSTMTGIMAGGGTPASIATGTIGLLAGIGMAGWDIYDLFIKGDEEEE